MLHRQGAVKVWFDYLQLAIRKGVPINEAYYSRWGTKEELGTTKFNRWWRERGRGLFVPDRALQEQSVTVEADGHGYVTVRIPTDLPMAVVNRSVGKIVTKARRQKHTRSFTEFAATGQVNYKTLAAYRRYLTIELDPRNSGRSVAEKAEILNGEYAKIHDRMKKQRMTMRQKGNVRAAARFHSHEADFFESTERETKLKLGGFPAKKAHRWKVSGQLVMLNVAEGRFPGDGYYGAKITESLRRRKQKMGITL